MIIELIEGMKELFLGSLFSRDDMNIVDEQHVRRAIVPVKQRHPIELDGVDHLVHESLARCVYDIQAAEVFEQAAADRMHQMGFTDPHAAINE